MTPEQVARERALADAVRGRGVDMSPVGHWTQGAARMVEALGGVLHERRAGAADEEGRAGARATIGADPVLSALLGGSGADGAQPVSGAAPAVVSSPAGGASAQAIHAGLVARGMPDHVAAAFVRNMQDESGLDPSINEVSPLVPGSRGGFGLVQWTGPRRVALERYAAERGTSPADMDTQLDFLMDELRGPEARAAQAIFSAPDEATAADAILRQFLRPAAEHQERRSAAYLGGAPGASYTAPNQNVVSALMAAQADPWVQEQYGPAIEALLGQQMQMQNAAYQSQLAQADPLYQAQLDRALLENEAMRSPSVPAPVWQGDRWWDLSSGVPVPLSDAPTEGPVWQGDRWWDVSSGAPVPLSDAPAEGPVWQGDQWWDVSSGAPVALTPPNGFTLIAPDEAEMLGLPEGSAYQREDATGRIIQIGGGGVNVTTNLGGDKFDETFGSQDAQAISQVSEAGMNAQRNLVRINQLEQLLASTPSGFMGGLAQIAGDWGISVEGLDNVQAAQAIIASLVPEQRPPGSGQVSDADLRLFIQSLPRVINQPGGNQLIMQTLRGLAEYDAQGAQIVQQLRSGEIDRSQAFQLLQSRPDPLAAARAALQGSDSPVQGGAPQAAASAPQAPPAATAMPPDAMPAPDASSNRFASMPAQELLSIDLDALTPAELAQWDAAMDALGF